MSCKSVPPVLLSFLALLTLTGGARAEQLEIDCSGMPSRYPCTLEDAGVRSAEEYAMRSYGLLRVTARYTVLGHDFSGEIVQPPFGGGWLRIRDTSDAGEGVSVQLKDADVQALMGLWRDFSVKVAKLDVAGRRSKLDDPYNPGCTEGGVVQVDLVQAGKARHVLMDDCLLPESGEFVRDLSKRMFSLAPLCAPPEQLLAYCLKLDGDKLAASQVAKLLEAWRRTGSGEAFERDLLSDRVNVDDRGVRIAGKKDVLAWLKIDRGFPLKIQPDRIEGQQDRVVVYGRVISLSHDRFYSAASTQTWRNEADGHYRVQSWTVGDSVETIAPF